MPAHVVYAQVDERPAGFSPFWIGEVLRRRLGFNGAIFSDDLSMAGAAHAGDHVDRARLALDAGVDMVLACNQPEAAGRVLDALAERPADPASLSRLERMRGRFPVARADLLASAEWQEASAYLSALSQSPIP